MCFTKRLFFIMALLGCSMVMGADLNPTNDALLEQLRHEDKGVRIAALRELQTTIDPRLPEELIRLLSDEGSSTRRLAARGIGSRYWQIPLERRPTYLEALERARKADPGIDLMADRAVALLSSSYNSPTTQRGPNGRWVLYERRSLPCLIDTRNGSEELLGWNLKDPMVFYSGEVFWHPEKEMLVSLMQSEGILERRFLTAFAWVHGHGLSLLDRDKVLLAFQIKPELRFDGGDGFFCNVLGWTEENARLECRFGHLSGRPGDPNDVIYVEGTVLWNPVTGTVEKEP